MSCCMTKLTGLNIGREQWYEFYHRLRKSGAGYRILGPTDPLVEKMEISTIIRKFEKDGKVRISDRFHDCDHAVSTCTRLVQATLVHVIAHMDDLYSNAEGCGSAWIHSPDDTCDPDFRDLALEAFEDGHAHSISEVRYETH